MVEHQEFGVGSFPLLFLKIDGINDTLKLEFNNICPKTYIQEKEMR